MWEAMSAMAVLVVLALYIGWAYLLYLLHLRLEAIDPELSGRIGRPSPFWTPFNGHAELVRLIRRRDLGNGPYAALSGLARLMRFWAVVTVGATVWMLWVHARTPTG